ncbi:MAG: tRNA (adenosine(37)-N6)-dimethylallyltransferase MiaA [Patescibacteria group bacterium]
MEKVKIIVIVGPTASGKSALAWELAQKYNGEIISADSRQVYRGLDIGTGKEKFPQHLIDVVDPSQDYNVSHFVRDAKKAIEEIHAMGKLPIIVGGTGFWIDALIFGYELPEVQPDRDLRRELEKQSAAELFEQLQKLDPFRAKHIDKHNKRRLIRAIEVAHSGAVFPSQPPPYGKGEEKVGNIFWIGIKIPKEELDHRIEKRLNEWFARGLIEEAKKIKNVERFGLAYTAIGKFLKGEIDEPTMRAEALKSIKQYAKRQMTWFKRNKNIQWITSPSDFSL